MKPEERIAEQFLTTRFGKKPDYEPLGKSRPPDFSIGTTAFEVRRLNQQFSIGGKSQGLEELLFALLEAVPAEMDKIPLSSEIGSFFYRLSFKRSLRSSPPGRIAKDIARQAHMQYLRGFKTHTVTVEAVEVEILPAPILCDKAFLLWKCTDYDSWGFTRGIHLKALQVALDEKAAKTKPVIQKFTEWILVLVNTIPGTNWQDVGPLSLNLHHFRGVAVLNREGSLTLERPYKSLPVSL